MKNILLNIKEELGAIRSNIDRRIGARDIILEDISKSNDKIREYEANKEDYDKILKLLQTLSDMKKDKIKNKIEKLITRGLSSVYSENYEYELDYEIKRDSIYVSPYVIQFIDGKKLKTPILDSRGGGISDIISFLNRVIILALYKPVLRMVMILDEPFKWVSREYLVNINKLLRTLNSLLKIQFIIVTHKYELIEESDKVFKTKRINGVSYIE